MACRSSTNSSGATLASHTSHSTCGAVLLLLADDDGPFDPLVLVLLVPDDEGIFDPLVLVLVLVAAAAAASSKFLVVTPESLAFIWVNLGCWERMATCNRGR